MAKQKDLYSKLLKKGFPKESIHKLLHKLVMNDMSFKDAIRQINSTRQNLPKP